MDGLSLLQEAVDATAQRGAVHPLRTAHLAEAHLLAGRIHTRAGRLASSSGMTVSVRGLASDIHSSLPHRLEGSTDRRRMIVGDGAASVTFNSMSGDLAVTRSKQASAPLPAEEKAIPKSAPVATGDDRLAVLGALERGEIDVDEAVRRLGEAG
jgi:hypothetical protein